MRGAAIHASGGGRTPSRNQAAIAPVHLPGTPAAASRCAIGMRNASPSAGDRQGWPRAQNNENWNGGDGGGETRRKLGTVRCIGAGLRSRVSTRATARRDGARLTPSVEGAAR